MKIIYAKKSSGIDEQGSFQNPDYYDKPDPSAEMVVIYGDYPQIKADYEELDIDVEVRELPKAKCAKATAENSELQEQLATAQGELIAFKNDVAAMQARIDELHPATKKPTTAEVKAAKAAEEAAKAQQSKE